MNNSSSSWIFIRYKIYMRYNQFIATNNTIDINENLVFFRHFQM